MLAAWRSLACGCGLLLVALSVTAEGVFLETTVLPGGQVLVVAEATLEPRSIGSYSLRLYSGKNPDFPYDDFLHGVIRPRDGVLESVTVLESGEQVEVVSRTVGSGAYRAVDLFAVTDDQVRWLKRSAL